MTNRSVLTVVGTIVFVSVVVLVLAVAYIINRPPQWTIPVTDLLIERAPTIGPLAGQVLLNQRGKGITSFDFTVPAECNQQKLASIIWPDTREIAYSWAEFEAIGSTGELLAHSGPKTAHDINEETFVWTLPNGGYSLVITGENVRWDFVLTCH